MTTDLLHIEIKNLKCIIKRQNSTILLLRSINRKLHSISFRMKSKQSKPTNKNVASITEGNLKDFMTRQLEVSKNPRGNRYNVNENMFSLSLWHSSPKCYRLLKTTFSLPSITTLRRSIRMIDMKPGFHQRVLDGIKEKATTYTLQESLVVIAFDEMSIKTFLQYDEQTDSVIVYEDLGCSLKSNKIASYATVFMVRSMLGSWKQPVGYFLTSGPMKSEVIVNKLRECITKVKECGLNPQIIICDQGPNNRGCNRLLNVTDGQYFIIGNDKIYFLYDPPHLLKSIRNGLLNNGFIFNGNDVSFKHIRELYELKKELNIDIAGKLSEKHINLNSFARMKVNLAVQALSQSVASGITCVVHLKGNLHPDALHTADFCEFFNNIFDIFNSKGKYRNTIINKYIYI